MDIFKMFFFSHLMNSFSWYKVDNCCFEKKISIIKFRISEDTSLCLSLNSILLHQERLGCLFLFTFFFI